jgi:phosphate transport system protein
MATRQEFDAELGQLEQDLLQMGRHVETMVEQCVNALLERDVALAQAVIKQDVVVDELDRSLEARCRRLLALQQPVSRDLRTIYTVLRASIDLERIGDYSVDIAEIALQLSGYPGSLPRVDLVDMAEAVKQVIRRTLQALVSHDLQAVRDIYSNDGGAVHTVYRRLFAELVELMSNERDQIPAAAQYLIVARSLERIADHITNVAEHLLYAETGVLEAAAVPPSSGN